MANTLLFGLLSMFIWMQESPVVAPGHWGPWKYSDYKTSIVEFRLRCRSDDVVDGQPGSIWEIQFRNRGDVELDFGWRAEKAASGSNVNRFTSVTRSNLQVGATSSRFEEQIYGSCEQSPGPEVEVLCATPPGLQGLCYEPDTDR